MPVASKAFPSVIASFVCWSLQCLVYALTQRGRWRTLFFRLTCSVALWGGREGVMLQTNNTGVRSQCLSHLFHREQSEAGPGLHAPPRSKPLRFRHSGSPQRRRLGWACILCPSQVRVAQVMRCLASTIAATYSLPAAWLSRCTTGAPSQADVDRPDCQEVLVSKEACLQFYR